MSTYVMTSRLVMCFVLDAYRNSFIADVILIILPTAF